VISPRAALQYWREAVAVFCGNVLLPTFLGFGLTPKPSVPLLVWSQIVAVAVLLTVILVEGDRNECIPIAENLRACHQHRALLRVVLWTGIADLFPVLLFIALVLVYSIAVQMHPHSQGMVTLLSIVLFLALFISGGRAIARRLYRAARRYRSLEPLPNRLVGELA
jgi:hypothetical protein